MRPRLGAAMVALALVAPTAALPTSEPLAAQSTCPWAWSPIEIAGDAEVTIPPSGDTPITSPAYSVIALTDPEGEPFVIVSVQRDEAGLITPFPLDEAVPYRMVDCQRGETGANVEYWVAVMEDMPLIGLPNPASVYCGENGGRTDIRTDPDGNQIGYCVFPDGSECEEWAFYNGTCTYVPSEMFDSHQWRIVGHDCPVPSVVEEEYGDWEAAQQRGEAVPETPQIGTGWALDTYMEYDRTSDGHLVYKNWDVFDTNANPYDWDEPTWYDHWDPATRTRVATYQGDTEIEPMSSLPEYLPLSPVLGGGVVITLQGTEFRVVERSPWGKLQVGRDYVDNDAWHLENTSAFDSYAGYVEEGNWDVWYEVETGVLLGYHWTEHRLDDSGAFAGYRLKSMDLKQPKRGERRAIWRPTGYACWSIDHPVEPEPEPENYSWRVRYERLCPDKVGLSRTCRPGAGDDVTLRMTTRHLNDLVSITIAAGEAGSEPTVCGHPSGMVWSKTGEEDTTTCTIPASLWSQYDRTNVVITVVDMNGNTKELEWVIDPAPPENFAAQTEFAAYTWRDDNGDDLIQDAELTPVSVVAGPELGKSVRDQISVAKPQTFDGNGDGTVDTAESVVVEARPGVAGSIYSWHYTLTPTSCTDPDGPCGRRGPARKLDCVGARCRIDFQGWCTAHQEAHVGVTVEDIHGYTYTWGFYILPTTDAIDEYMAAPVSTMTASPTTGQATLFSGQLTDVVTARSDPRTTYDRPSSSSLSVDRPEIEVTWKPSSSFPEILYYDIEVGRETPDGTAAWQPWLQGVTIPEGDDHGSATWLASDDDTYHFRSTAHSACDVTEIGGSDANAAVGTDSVSTSLLKIYVNAKAPEPFTNQSHDDRGFEGYDTFEVCLYEADDTAKASETNLCTCRTCESVTVDEQWTDYYYGRYWRLNVETVNQQQRSDYGANIDCNMADEARMAGEDCWTTYSDCETFNTDTCPLEDTYQELLHGDLPVPNSNVDLRRPSNRKGWVEPDSLGTQPNYEPYEIVYLLLDGPILDPTSQVMDIHMVDGDNNGDLDDFQAVYLDYTTPSFRLDHSYPLFHATSKDTAPGSKQWWGGSGDGFWDFRDGSPMGTSGDTFTWVPNLDAILTDHANLCNQMKCDLPRMQEGHISDVEDCLSYVATRCVMSALLKVIPGGGLLELREALQCDIYNNFAAAYTEWGSGNKTESLKYFGKGCWGIASDAIGLIPIAGWYAVALELVMCTDSATELGSTLSAEVATLGETVSISVYDRVKAVLKQFADSITFGLGSPAELHVLTPDGRHVGPTPGGGFEIGVPGAAAFEVEGHQIVVVPNDGTAYAATVIGIEEGAFDLTLIERDSTLEGRVTEFTGVETRPGAVATIGSGESEPTLWVDPTGDGKTRQPVVGSPVVECLEPVSPLDLVMASRTETALYRRDLATPIGPAVDWPDSVPDPQIIHDEVGHLRVTGYATGANSDSTMLHVTVPESADIVSIPLATALNGPVAETDSEAGVKITIADPATGEESTTYATEILETRLGEPYLYAFADASPFRGREVDLTVTLLQTDACAGAACTHDIDLYLGPVVFEALPEVCTTEPDGSHMLYDHVGDPTPIAVEGCSEPLPLRFEEVSMAATFDMDHYGTGEDAYSSTLSLPDGFSLIDLRLHGPISEVTVNGDRVPPSLLRDRYPERRFTYNQVPEAARWSFVNADQYVLAGYFATGENLIEVKVSAANVWEERPFSLYARFVAPTLVEETEGPDVQANLDIQPLPEDTAGPPADESDTRLVIALGLLAAAVAGGFVWWRHRGKNSPDPQSD